MTTKEVSFACSWKDEQTITKIVKRARSLNKKVDGLSLRMDLTAAHANGCPMDFDRLLEADDFNFLHDIYGISRHINRETGELMNCFLPRFAKKEA